ncbi:MAG: amidohydrolase family protein [Spirochaetales bacterium]|nr:amidohydrolase family protein [Spirochaetales bacterium]
MANYALVNCNLIDGKKAGIQPAMTLLIRSGKIFAVGRSEDIKDTSGYKTIDLGGKYVLPGLINAHMHLPLTGKGTKASSAGASQERLLKILKTRIGRSLLLGMMKTNAAAQLHSGVTTCRSMGDLFYTDIKLRNMVNSGKAPGPRLLVSGPIITPTGGHGRNFGVVADSPWEVRRAVRRNIQEQVDVIKIASTGGVTDALKLGEAGRPTMSLEEVTAACVEAHMAGLMVASHAESTEGVRIALKAGVDTIEHGASLDDEMIELFLHNPKSLRGYSSLIPTLYPAITIGNLDSSITYMTDVQIKNSVMVYEGMISGMKTAVKAGIKVGLGTDASTPFVTQYNTWRELEFVIKYAGMSAQRAIDSATRINAEIMGIDDVTGTLEADKASDLIVVQKNPLEDIRSLKEVSMVMHGELFIDKPKFKTIPEVDRAIDSISFMDS